MSDSAVVEWLLAGDPVIRWQTMRDLLDEPVEVWEAERRRTLEAGWVADLLSHQGRDGEWPKGRWTDSVWTLLLLVACGLPEGHPSSRAPVQRLLGRFMPTGEEVDTAFLLNGSTSAISASGSGSARTCSAMIRGSQGWARRCYRRS